MREILPTIQNPAQLHALDAIGRAQLCSELRSLIIDSVANSGGHLASNLGVIELTVALLAVFNPPQDKIIWDVGHQTYAYKILTGRRERIGSIRQLGGLAPFSKRSESSYDAFGGGHSSTAISAALGMAICEQRAHQNARHIAIIGDGGLGAGMAFEALNHAGQLGLPLLLIVNDNSMSISENVGYLHQDPHAIAKLAQALGFAYKLVTAGNNVEILYAQLQQLRDFNSPIMLHINTIKGKGFAAAEADPVGFHGIGSFHLPSGALKNTATAPSFSAIVGDFLLQELAHNPNLMLISPAMLLGSGLEKCSAAYPQQVFDVGIAEQHAVTLAAGMAAAGAKVVVAIYATFLQRAIDQLIHDVALQNLAVVFAIDRAGLVGADGASHHGYFDLAQLIQIPNMLVMTPSSFDECELLFKLALNSKQPCALRYPRGTGVRNGVKHTTQIEIGRANVVLQGHQLAILAFGSLLQTVLPIAQKRGATLVDMRFAKPLDGALIKELSQTHDFVVTVEEGVVCGGAGSAVRTLVQQFAPACRLLNLGLQDCFYEHGSREQLLALAGLDAAGMEAAIHDFMAS